MSATAIRKPPTPKRLQKRKLTIAQAADLYELTTAKLAKLAEQAAPVKAEQAEAEEVMLAHFDRTEKAAYKDRIGWKWTGGSLILDQDKAKKFLGERLGEFMTRSKRKRSLTLLK